MRRRGRECTVEMPQLWDIYLDHILRTTEEWSRKGWGAGIPSLAVRNRPEAALTAAKLENKCGEAKCWSMNSVDTIEIQGHTLKSEEVLKVLCPSLCQDGDPETNAGFTAAWRAFHANQHQLTARHLPANSLGQMEIGCFSGVVLRFVGMVVDPSTS